MWYAAHIIMSVQFKNPEDQTSYPVWETIVLIQASTSEQAWDKAEQRGRDEETDGSDGFTWNRKPARWVFAGVRKVIECRSDDEKDRPVDGAEVSYSEMSVPDKESLTKLANGRPVSVQYEE